MMQKKIILVIALLFGACSEQKVEQVQSIADPIMKDVTTIAKPVVNKGLDLAKEAYPVARQAIQDSADSFNQIDSEETKRRLKSAFEAATNSALNPYGADVHGNINYGLGQK